MFFGAVWSIANPHYPKILLLEYGIDHQGEMDIQIDIAEPDVALFTRLSPSHTEGFKSIDLYYAEKQKLIRSRQKKTY